MIKSIVVCQIRIGLEILAEDYYRIIEKYKFLKAFTLFCVFFSFFGDEQFEVIPGDVLEYLGTGFDVYLTDEPCAMCAMALVHFRVGRVFYGKRAPSNGVYESCWRIQEEKSLNHHYSVFRIDECI